MRRIAVALFASAAAGLSCATPSFPATAADPPQITLELNKLEPIAAAAIATGSSGQAAGCRAYLVANNPENGETVDVLRLDLVLFGTDGVIGRRLALDLGPLPPGRTQVRPFDLRDQPCDGVGQILVNEVLLCRVAGTDLRNPTQSSRAF